LAWRKKTHGVLSLEGTDEPPQDPLGPLLLVPSLSDIGKELGSFSPVSGELGERGRGEDKGRGSHAREIAGHAGQRLLGHREDGVGKVGIEQKEEGQYGGTNLDERRPSGLLCLGDNVGTYHKDKGKTNERVVSDLVQAKSAFPNGTQEEGERNPGREDM
jgi:hypothetical protein